MTRNEVVELLEQINAAYPNKIEQTETTFNLWLRQMKDQTAADVFRRLDAYILVNKFAPGIGDLKRVERPEHNKNPLQKYEHWKSNASQGPSEEQKLRIREILSAREG
ncbi:hypothetical protein FLK61_26030 [Paenalkalicoccus suaedae]|uniref:Replicative helicase inhibitor G39P N-terminal domain-containing protein n=1 Tax=Paenalkalicoccus suaedae TaxID=2592382 RepID=A0A859FAC0_9BACI|nr:replicative helicase loader/inhibitor [Paenalkalicoccus suaedae]QKS70223.1 hypothetical protein FLK61_26030 [Paenalkalicoccus suaedae]